MIRVILVQMHNNNNNFHSTILTWFPTWILGPLRMKMKYSPSWSRATTWTRATIWL